MSLLELDDVRRAFGGVRALDGLSLRVAAGELLAIVGPNGAGKSTLVQTITGFERIDAGSIRFDGAAIARLSPERIAKRGIARTFQTSRVFPELSVWDSVRIGAHAWPHRATQREIDADAERVLARFGDRLTSKRAASARSLSYANRRRLEIARTLLARPRLWLLDEPTAGMNPTESLELAEVIAQVRRDEPNLAVILIEHKLDVVRRLTQRVVVMDAGRMLVDATPDVAFADPRVVEAYLGREAVHV